MRSGSGSLFYLATAAVAATSLAAYVWAVASIADHQRSPYSLDKLATAPIPKWEFFSLWNEAIAGSCPTVAKPLGIDAGACRTAIVDKRMECYQHVAKFAPEQVSSADLARDLSRKYLQCVTPYQYCQAISGRASPLEVLCNNPTRSARAKQSDQAG